MTTTTWETPQAFFDMLHSEFKFQADVCATDRNAKCRIFFSPEMDALTMDWTGCSARTLWMNPPYGRGQNVYAWVEKAHSAAKAGKTVVCLLPASLDTRWFRKFCMRADEIRVVEDRLWFSLNGDKPRRANHASMVVIFRPKRKGPPKLSTVPNCKPFTR